MKTKTSLVLLALFFAATALPLRSNPQIIELFSDPGFPTDVNGYPVRPVGGEVLTGTVHIAFSMANDYGSDGWLLGPIAAGREDRTNGGIIAIGTSFDRVTDHYTVYIRNLFSGGYDAWLTDGPGAMVIPGVPDFTGYNSIDLGYESFYMAMPWDGSTADWWGTWSVSGNAYPISTPDTGAGAATVPLLAFGMLGLAWVGRKHA